MAIGLCFVCAFALTASATSPDSARALDPTLDARLTARVSYKRDRCTTAELLRAIGEQANVRVVADEGSGAGDVAIAACVQDAAIVDVLKSVESLFSHTDAPWVWVRDRAGETWTYTLHRSAAAQRLGKQIRDWVDQKNVRMLRHLAQLAMLPESERVSRAGDIGDALGISDPSQMNRLAKDTRFWTRFILLSSTLRDQDWQTLMDRGRIERIVPSELSQQARAALQAIYAEYSSTQSTVPGPGQLEPKWIQLRCERSYGSPVPMLTLDMAGIAERSSFGGGALQRILMDRLLSIWSVGNISADDPVFARNIKAPSEPQTAGSANARFPLSRRLLEMGSAAHLSVLARLPLKQFVDPGSPYGKTVREFIGQCGPYRPLAKVQNGILLLSPAAWPFEEEMVVPVRIRRELVNRLRASKGLLTEADMLWAAASLSDPQLDGLSDEFTFATHLHIWKPLLALAYHSPQFAAALKHKPGVPINDSLRDALTVVEERSRQQLLAAYPKAANLQTFMKSETGPAGPKSMLVFDLCTEQGDMLVGMGFSWQPEPPDKYADPK